MRAVRARAWIPGTLHSPAARVVAGVFYGCLVVAVWRSPIWVEHCIAGRADGWFALAGLVFLYWAAVCPFQALTAGWRRYVRRFEANRTAVVGLAVLVTFLGVALFAPLIAPFDPAAQPDPAGTGYLAPSWEHPMGTDKFGRDIFSRVVYGARLSLSVAFAAVVVAAVLGLLIGAFSGYSGGLADDVIMRIVDGLLAFPRLLLLLLLVAFFSGSAWVVVVLLGGTGWMGLSRLVRADVLALKRTEFVEAARASGAGRRQVVTRHLIPNVLGTVLVGATLRMGAIILLESYLSFLGLGVQPPTPSWGVMVYEGRDVLLSAWWVSLFPGLAILGAVIACNLVGDGLRDALEPRGA